MNEDSDDIQELRNEIKRLLAAALNGDAKHDAEMQRRDDAPRRNTRERRRRVAVSVVAARYTACMVAELPT